MKIYANRMNKELYLLTENKILKLQKNKNEGLFFLFSNDNKLLFCNDSNIYDYYKNKNQSILCYDLFQFCRSCSYNYHLRTYIYNKDISYMMHYYLTIYDKIVNLFHCNKDYNITIDNNLYHIDYKDKTTKCNKLIEVLNEYKKQFRK